MIWGTDYRDSNRGHMENVSPPHSTRRQHKSSTYAFVNAVEEIEVLAVALADALGGNALQAGTVLVRVLLALGLAGLADRGHHVNGFFSGLYADSTDAIR